MSNCATNFAYANEEEMFIKKESVCGTLEKPGASHRVYTIGPFDGGQEQEFLDDEQIRASASKRSPIKGKKNPGEWSCSTYVKPSGTKGTAPEHDVLFDCAMGNKTVNAGTSVVYTLANQLDSFSAFVKKGHTVFAHRGCTIQGLESSISGDAIATLNWSGNSMEMLWAGTCKASGAYAGGESAIVLANGGAELYKEGMYINIGDDTNGGAGYKITDVNYNKDTLTISPVLASNQGTAPEVSPWLPTASSEVGTPVHGKLGMVTVAGQDAIILSAGVTLTNNIKYYTDEKNNVFTAERFGRPGFRDVEGNLDLFYLKRGTSYFYRAEHQVANALIIPAGNVSGYIMEISVPYAEYRTPKVSGDEEFQQSIPFIGVASASLNDELSITFK